MLTSRILESKSATNLSALCRIVWYFRRDQEMGVGSVFLSHILGLGHLVLPAALLPGPGCQNRGQLNQSDPLTSCLPESLSSQGSVCVCAHVCVCVCVYTICVYIIRQFKELTDIVS